MLDWEFFAYTAFIFLLGGCAHAVLMMWLDTRRARRSDIQIARGKRAARLDIASTKRWRR